jgi:hypothetical protein
MAWKVGRKSWKKGKNKDCSGEEGRNVERRSGRRPKEVRTKDKVVERKREYQMEW